MKNALIALLAVASALNTSAQKHNLYTDAGLSLDYFSPGLSATYNYNIRRHIGIGAGVQGYGFYATVTRTKQITPAIFADFRVCIRPKHISQYFVFADLGMDFYKHNDDSVRRGNYVNTVPDNNGVYFGLGIGYFLRLTSRGWGPYFTVKLINNFSKQDQLNTVTGDKKSLTVANGTAVVSLGFRFGDYSKKPVRSELSKGIQTN